MGVLVVTDVSGGRTDNGGYRGRCFRYLFHTAPPGPRRTDSPETTVVPPELSRVDRGESGIYGRRPLPWPSSRTTPVRRVST